MPDATPSVEILGKWLIALHVLDMLPDEQEMAEFLRPMLREAPGIADAFVRLNDSDQLPPHPLTSRPDVRFIPIGTPRRSFGNLEVVIDDVEGFITYEPFLINIGHMIATILENRENATSLAAANEQLEQLIDELEVRVGDRTRELTRRAQRFAVLLDLPVVAETLDEVAFMQYGLASAEELTGSLISFIHFVNPDDESFELMAWSRRTLEQYCNAVPDNHYPVKEAGVWADAFRERRPMVYNDYAAIPHRNGLPEGHAELLRLISLPVIVNDRVVLIAGIGNKATDYDDYDVETMQSIVQAIWRIVASKRSELVLRLHHDQLEEEVKVRTAELEEAVAAADAANRAKSVFLANMSHELRTPLNAILGFSDILGLDPDLSHTQQRNLAIIHRSGDHLLGVINDVLDMATIEAGGVRLTPEPFDLGAMVMGVTDMMRIRAEAKDLELLVEQRSAFPRYIVGDEAKLRQVLINLISNAIRATEQGGVTVRLDVQADPLERLVIEVEDTGRGIAAEDQVGLFQPFVQVGAQGAQQGTGLGLAITDQIVRMMGGQVSVTSAFGRGSTFRVALPVRFAPPEAIPLIPVARGHVIGLEPGQPAYRVLVVDDQEDNRILLEQLLEVVGCEVSGAASGIEAVERCQSWHPHFVWMDRRMPGIDGLEAAKRIRALPGGDKIRIAAVTASTFRQEDAQLTSGRFDALVHKPFRADQIYDCMENLLGVRFVRGEAPPPPAPAAVLSAEEIATLPEPLQRELGQALLTLDTDRITEVVDKIAQRDRTLAAAIKERAESFDYSAILALLPPA